MLLMPDRIELYSTKNKKKNGHLNIHRNDFHEIMSQHETTSTGLVVSNFVAELFSLLPKWKCTFTHG